MSDIVNQCAEWCFTDGHAKTAITTFYNNINDIDQVDIELAYARYWHSTDDDLDKMRKKQAEFLVKHFVPPACITNIVVYDAERQAEVKKIEEELNLNLNIYVNPKGKYYY